MPDNRKRRQQMRQTNYYIEGNTVRKLEAEPERKAYEQRRRTAEERRRRAEKRRNQEIARKNQERALRLNLTYTVFLFFRWRLQWLRVFFI